jgi:hypothetical protein
MISNQSRPAPAFFGRLRVWPVLAGLAGLFLAAGCAEEEGISHYKVPKPPPQRLLGAIIPHGDTTWFFKLVGPQPAIANHEKEFKQFIASVRFPDKPEMPITYNPPEGWREINSREKTRHQTFALGTPDSRLELSVTPLGAEGETRSLLKNVNRWRGQLGLPNVTEAELGKLTETIKVAGEAATLVDLKPEKRASAPAGEK